MDPQKRAAYDRDRELVNVSGGGDGKAGGAGMERV